MAFGVELGTFLLLGYYDNYSTTGANFKNMMRICSFLFNDTFSLT
jgi:hypothetical protein